VGYLALSVPSLFCLASHRCLTKSSPLARPDYVAPLVVRLQITIVSAIRSGRARPQKLGLYINHSVGNEAFRRSPLSPQENQSCREPKSASTRMKDTPPPDHEARFCRGGVQSRVHQAVASHYRRAQGVTQRRSCSGGSAQDSLANSIRPVWRRRLITVAGLIGWHFFGGRAEVLKPDGGPVVTVMDFGQPFPHDPLPSGWRHRKFWTR
jgi:hypothetical protein